MKNELKSCPFCGGDAQLSHFKLFTRCPKCRSGSSDWLSIRIWNSRPTEPKEDNCTCGAQHGTIDGDQKCTDGCLNNNPEPKTKIAEHGKAQYDKVGNVAIYPDNKDYKPVGKRFILVPVCDEATK